MLRQRGKPDSVWNRPDFAAVFDAFLGLPNDQILGSKPAYSRWL
jgi:hypothetical protein